MSFSEKLDSLHDLANKLVEAVDLLCSLSRDMIPQINTLQRDERIFDCMYSLRIYCTEQFERLEASIDEIRMSALMFNEAKQQAIQQLQTLLQIANQAFESNNAKQVSIQVPKEACQDLNQIRIGQEQKDQALSANKKKSKGGFLKFFLQCNGRLRDAKMNKPK